MLVLETHLKLSRSLCPHPGSDPGQPVWTIICPQQWGRFQLKMVVSHKTSDGWQDLLANNYSISFARNVRRHGYASNTERKQIDHQFVGKVTWCLRSLYMIQRYNITNQYWGHKLQVGYDESHSSHGFQCGHQQAGYKWQPPVVITYYSPRLILSLRVIWICP